MKQSKRMLSVLLALLMICSTFTIGAQALKAEILTPAYGYDEVLDPVVSSEQAARMILDEVEPLLADIDDVDLKVMTLKLSSIDNILNSLVELDDSTLADIALGLLGGDLNDLNLRAGKVKDSKGNNCRRGNSTSTDFEVLGAVLTVLETNADIVCKAAYDGIDFGLLDSLGVFGQDDLAALKDIRGMLATLLDKLLITGEEFEFDIATEYNSNKSIDGILQEFIDNKLVKLIVDLLAEDDGTNMAADILGLNNYLAADGTLTQDIPTTTVFPSLTDGEGKLGKLSIANDSFYDFFIKIVKAAVYDVVVPYAGMLLGDLIDDDIAGIIDAVVALLELDVDLTVCTSAQDKVDTLLRYLLIDGGIKKLFLFKQGTSPTGVTVSYLSVADGFWTKLTGILRTALPMLPPLLGDDCPNFDKPDAELSQLGANEFFTYVLQRVLEKFVDGVQFADDCLTIRELASRTLIEVCKDLMPEKNFEEMFEANPPQMVYDSDDCLTLGAYVIRYYLNGETTIQDNTPDSEMNLTSMLNTAADWALNKYGSVIGYKPANYTNSSVWQKVFDTVFQILPLNLFVGAAPVNSGMSKLYMPGIPNTATGLQNLILDDILGGVLEFNITEGELADVGVTGLNKVLSLIGRRGDSELNKPIPQFLMDLVARVINPLFGLPTESYVEANPGYDQLNLIIPYGYTSLDQLVTANHNTSSLSLTNTLYRLCKNIGFINSGADSIFYAGCPVIAQIMGLWGAKDQKYTYTYFPKTAPSDFNGGRLYTYDTLKALYAEYADSDDAGIEYDDPAYSYFHMVDFKPFLYLEFKRARSDVRSLLSDYESGEIDAVTFKTEATNAAYKLLSIVDVMNDSYNREYWNGTRLTTETLYGETMANDNQLIKVINKANALNLVQDNGEGSLNYTERSWAAYTRAKAFADAVEAEYQAANNAGSERDNLLRDMRQSKINTARKMLVDAIARLKSWVPLADYSMLDVSLEMASGVTSLRKYNKKTVQKALNAYMEAYNIPRDYDMDDQFIVDDVQQTLDEILNEGFNNGMVDYLELWNDGFGQYIDEDNSYLYGLPEGFATEQEIEMVGGMFDWYMANYGMAMSPIGDSLVTDITSTPTGNGTGAVIKMYGYTDEGEIDYSNVKEAKYTVIVFGDVDGDAFANAMDSTVLSAYCKLMLNDAQFGAPSIYAADVNESGTIDTRDAKFIESAGLQKEFVNQAPESLIYRTFGILDVLGLRESA